MNKIGIHIFLVLIIGALLFMVSRGQFMPAALVLAGLLACKLVTVRGPLIYWAILFEFAHLQVPLTSIRMLSLALIFQALFVGGELLNNLAGKERLRQCLSGRWIIAFVLCLILLAKVRGFGIYALGGTGAVGGMDYIIFGIRLLFLAFAATYIEKHGLHYRTLCTYALIGAVIFCTANMITYFIPSLADTVSKAIRVTFVAQAGEIRTYEKRIPAFLEMAFALIPFVMNIKDVVRRNGLALLCIMLAALSGFRTSILLIALLVGFIELRTYGITGKRFFAYGTGGLFLLTILWIAAPNLDPRIQRAMSVIPGFSERVEAGVSSSTSDSTNWRVELYKYSMEQLPDYIVLGRGLGTQLSQVLINLNKADAQMHAWYAYEIHAYHLANLELVLDYGLIPALIFVCACVTRSRSASHQLNQLNVPSYFDRYAVICAWVMAISMFTFLSDFRTTYFHLLMFGFIAASNVGNDSFRAPVKKIRERGGLIQKLHTPSR